MIGNIIQLQIDAKQVIGIDPIMEGLYEKIKHMGF
jgi:hypothetical protein